MITPTEKDKKALAYLKIRMNKELLNDLLFLHETYGLFIKRYLDYPDFCELNNEMNKFYMRELVPSIKFLVEGLKLDPEKKESPYKLPKNYILFTNLLMATKELMKKPSRIEYVNMEISNVYGDIKELVEFAGVFQGEPTSKTKIIIEKARELINKSRLLEKNSTKDSSSYELKIGPLKYKNYSIFYNEKNLELTPQLVDMCKLFMEVSQRNDMFITDESIIDKISRKDSISNINMQKAVSKLRITLKKENRLIKIKRVDNRGYIFVVKKIR